MFEPWGASCHVIDPEHPEENQVPEAPKSNQHRPKKLKKLHRNRRGKLSVASRDAWQ